MVATHRHDDGKKRYKVSADLDDLLAWKAHMSSGGDDEQNAEGGD